MEKRDSFPRDLQYAKFSLYGALKNLQFFEPFIILFFRQEGLSFLQIGTLFAVREIATNLLEVPTGVLADSFGRKKTMILSFIAYIVSFILIGLVPSFGLLAVAMVFFGIGEAARSGTHKAMILSYLEQKNLLAYKVDYYGHTRGWAQFGSALSALAAAALVFLSGSYRIVFLASVVPYLLDMLLIISYPASLDGETAPDGLSPRVLAEGFRGLGYTIRSFGAVLRRPSTLRALANAALFDGGFKTVKVYLQPILKQYALLLPILVAVDSERRVSLVVGIVYFALYLLTFAAASSSGEVNRRIARLHLALNLGYAAGIVLILLSGVCLFFNLHVPAILLLVLLYILENLKRPMNIGYYSELVSSRMMATGLSVESQLTTLIVAVLSPAIGFLADRAGVGAGLGAVGILLLLTVPIALVREPAAQPDEPPGPGTDSP